MKNCIYDLELNESMFDGSYCITRVPGGWLYLYSEVRRLDGPTIRSHVFVPFNLEYKTGDLSTSDNNVKDLQLIRPE
jgi:hypothetical protein